MPPPPLLQRLAVVAQLGIAATHAGDYPTRKGGSSFSSYGGDQQAYLDEKAAQKSVTVLESGLMYTASGFIPSCSAGLLLGLSSSQRHHCQLTVHTGS